MSPNIVPSDPVESTSPADVIVDTALPALQWARVLLIVKQHGIVAALVLVTIYQIGLIAQAQTYVCGV